MLEIATQVRTNTARVALIGELDLATTSILEDALRHLESSGPDRIILDLCELGFMDAGGLHVILAAKDRAKRSGASLVLERAQPPVTRLLELTGADEVLSLGDEDDELSFY